MLLRRGCLEVLDICTELYPGILNIFFEISLVSESWSVLSINFLTNSKYSGLV